MVTVKHSPAPWKVVRGIETWMVASCGDGLMIQSARCHGDALGRAECDAALISAAPELLQIAKLILKEWEAPTDGVHKGELIARLSQYADLARAAIDKAEDDNL